MSEAEMLQLYREHTSRGHYGGIIFKSWCLAIEALYGSSCDKEVVKKAYSRCMSQHRGGIGGWYLAARVLKELE